MSYGTDQHCSEIHIAPHPDAETVEILKCDGTPVAATCRDMRLVPFGTLPCDCPTPHVFPGTPHQFDCLPVATENSTWGSIKALYRD
jgi:hypothetical protein